MYTPYFGQFGRHPHFPGVINTEQELDQSAFLDEVTDEHLETKAKDIADIHAKVMVKWQYVLTCLPVCLWMNPSPSHLLFRNPRKKIIII